MQATKLPKKIEATTLLKRNNIERLILKLDVLINLKISKSRNQKIKYVFTT